MCLLTASELFDRYDVYYLSSVEFKRLRSFRANKATKSDLCGRSSFASCASMGDKREFASRRSSSCFSSVITDKEAARERAGEAAGSMAAGAIASRERKNRRCTQSSCSVFSMISGGTKRTQSRRGE